MTPILGAARCSAEEARAWSRSKGAPDFWANLAPLYWDIFPKLGVRPDVGFAQASHETGHGWFGRAVTAMHHNPCGLKVLNPGADDAADSHKRFPDWPTGITAHRDHLHLYAKAAVAGTPDPRHFPYLAGAATTVEALSGKWAPSSTYHLKLLAFLEEMVPMTAHLTWLPDVLRDAGVKVEVMAGAERRTSRDGGLAVRGVVWHHTATGTNWTDANVAKLLRDGRADLPGPLSQVGIERDGTWVIVAMGRANHNGYGTWGNDSLGLEFYNSGVGEPWPDIQVRSGIVGTAAVLKYLGKTIHDVKGHKETDARRKIDPAGLDMPTIRRQIDAHMRHPIATEENDMHAGDIIASYAEAYGPLTKQQGADIRVWIHTVYAKQPHERDGAVAYIRALLGLK